MQTCFFHLCIQLYSPAYTFKIPCLFILDFMQVHFGFHASAFIIPRQCMFWICAFKILTNRKWSHSEVARNDNNLKNRICINPY